MAEHMTVLNTDVEPSLRSPEALEYFSSKGIAKRATAAFDHDANAAIERVFGELRDAVETATKLAKPEDDDEVRWMIYTIENDFRNVLQRGGFSSSQRAFGRGSRPRSHLPRW